VSFDAPSGRRFTDCQVVSLDTHIGLTRVERKDINDVAKSLDEIKREVKKWSAWGGGSGLRIVTEVDMRERYERFLETRPSSADDQNHNAEDEDARAADESRQLEGTQAGL
jgi:hypothetical protein